MRKLAILLVLCFMVSLLPEFAASKADANASGDNLIQNEGFENGVSAPAQWTFNSVSGGAMQWDQTEAYRGNKSVKLSLPASGARAILEQKDIPVTAGKQYEYRFFSRKDQLNGEAFVTFDFYDSTGALLPAATRQIAITLANSDAGWQQYAQIITMPATAVKTNIRLQAWKGTGDVWYDEISLKLYEPSGNLLKNPSFEYGNASAADWSFLTTVTGTWLWDAQEKFDGNRSIRLTTSANTDRAILEQRNIGLEGGAFYKLDFAGRTDAYTGTAFITLDLYDQQGQLLPPATRQIAINLTNPAPGWNQYSQILYIPASAATVVMRLQSWKGVGDVWFDNIRLERYAPVNNRILNPSLEEGGTALEHWSFIPIGQGAWTWDSVEKYEGGRSVRLETYATADRAILEQKNIPVTANMPFQFSFYARTDSFNGEAFVTLEWYDAEGVIFPAATRQVAIKLTDLPSGWNKLEQLVQVPDGAAFVNVRLQAWKGEGKVWYDMLRLAPFHPLSGISPQKDTYNKQSPSPQNLTVMLDLQAGETLDRIMYGQTELQQGQDYEISGQVVRLLPGFLTGLPNGSNTLSFKLSSGTDRELEIEVIDQAVSGLNLAVNSGFEEGAGGDLYSWTFVNQAAAASRQWSQSPVHGGDRSVTLDNMSGDGPVAMQQAFLPIQGGWAYQFSAYYRSQLNNGFPALRLTWYANIGEPALKETVVKGLASASDWRKLYTEEIAPPESRFVTISLESSGGQGTVVFDDADIRRSNALHNAAFSEGQGNPYYWSYDLEGGAGIDWNAGAPAGQVHLNAAESTGDTAAVVRTHLPVQAEKNYYAGIRYKTSGAAVPAARILWFDKEGKFLSMDHVRGGSASDWQELALTRFAPKGASWATIRYEFDGGSGDIWFTAAEFRQTLVNVYGELVPVTDVEDVNEPLAPQEFWGKFPAPDLQPPQGSIWTQEVLRNFLLGPYQHFETEFKFQLPASIKARDATMPVVSGSLGQSIDAGMPAMVVAEDIEFHPIMSGAANSSMKYYPRRTMDYLLKDYYPSYIFTGDDYFKNRAKELLEFQKFTRWREDGSNLFVEKYDPARYALHPEWAGGWDFLFDWQWVDGTGYMWDYHSADHHVSAGIAASLYYAYEFFGRDQENLDMGRSFVYNMIPRYGFHKGVWNNHTYYWTEYNPSGQSEGNPTNDAVDNANALISLPVAMAGYYETDPVLKRQFLELARGMVWYLVREFDSEARFYYYGSESDKNNTGSAGISHDRVNFIAFLTMSYLYKAGVDISDLLEGFANVEETYYNNWSFYQGRSHMKVFKVYDETPAANETLSYSTFVQMTADGLEDVRFKDTIDEHDFIVPATLDVRFSKINPPTASEADWMIDPAGDVVLRVTPAELAEGITLPFALNKWELMKVTYELTAQPTFDRMTAKNYDSELMAWVVDDQNRATYVKAGSGRSGEWPNAFTLPLSTDYLLNSENFLTFGSRLLFPFAEETASKLVVPPAPQAEVYHHDTGWGSVQADEYVYPVQSLLTNANTGGKLLTNSKFDAKGKVFEAAAAGDQATFTFELFVPDRTYQVFTNYTKSLDHGKWRLLIDGQPVGPEYDGYSPKVEPVYDFGINQGSVQLARGSHTITYEVTGKNPAATRYYAGLYDAIVLKPIDQLPTTSPSLQLTAAPDALTTGPVAVTVAASVYGAGNSLRYLKWAEGERSIQDFETEGEVIPVQGAHVFEAEHNGIYTVFAQDLAGNRSVETIAIANIVREKPILQISLSQQAPTNQPVVVTVNSIVYGDFNGISELKVEQGEHPADYFHTGGDYLDIGDPSFEVHANGIYTVYVKDLIGNEQVETIVIDQIITTAPVLQWQLSPVGQTAGEVTVTVSAQVYGEAGGNRVSEWKWAYGEQPTGYFSNGGQPIGETNIPASFKVAYNGTYTIYAKDLAGNEKTELVVVNQIAAPENDGGSGNHGNSGKHGNNGNQGNFGNHGNNGNHGNSGNHGSGGNQRGSGKPTKPAVALTISE